MPIVAQLHKIFTLTLPCLPESQAIKAKLKSIKAKLTTPSYQR
jgi:hypothetical protein